MNAINEEPEPHEIEALLPWYAAGTLSRRDANRVEQALAGDRELARQYDLVREELVETIHLNERLGAPSTRAIERLFAAIDAEEAPAPRHGHGRWFDLGSRISEFLWSLTPRTLARSAMVAAFAILLQAAVIASVIVIERGSPRGPELASAPNEGPMY
jgi:anti-sigma-K factor RskA